MLKLYADITELNERDVTAKALKHLRISALLSLPLVPLMVVMSSDISMNYISQSLVLLAFFVSLIALVATCLSKLVNRVWVRDQYLDEWEIGLKHRSMAFAFQVVLYALTMLLLLGGALYYFDMLSLLTTKPEMIGCTLLSILALGLYAQIFVQLAMIEPIEADELDKTSGARRPIKGVFAVSGVLIAMFIVLPIAFGVTLDWRAGASGVTSDWRAGSEVSLLSNEARTTCEARGSRVHWVSINESNYGFACFDENRPSPDRSGPKDGAE